ncbi:sigma-70 family RNA polymerase sigma factor [Lysobacter terrestris]|uniref:Sigma-70 family RNA polymerase sigma factor n=1 Tax=Agrilutibacter terrestris TaxID=2865112 RepID=A0A7H0G1M9_9GAMM|nr:sigma-70 family RNA polymerase sigma factor [Lysobacter terrestris]
MCLLARSIPQVPVSNPSNQANAGAGEELVALLAAVASGSRDDFEALYRATSAKLFGICLGLLPDRAEAEDVLQEVYASVWHKAAQFDAARASAITWMGTIARHKAIDRLRTLPGPYKNAPIEFAESIADPLPSPLQHAEATTQRARLDGCMEQLDDRRRALIRTAFFDGATYEELAARSGSPLGSIKSWIRRGLMQLRVCLEQ